MWGCWRVCAGNGGNYLDDERKIEPVVVGRE
jgi:hypothetical protein